MTRVGCGAFRWDAVSVVDGLSWVVTDRQATATGTVPAGTVSTTAINRYRPYGTNRAADAITATARGFLARNEDPNGLIATDHRLYDPTIGRFLTIDPLLDHTKDPYGYGAANPATFADPSGLCAPDFCWSEWDWVKPTFESAVLRADGTQDGYFLSRNGCGICTAQELAFHARVDDGKGVAVWHREALALSDHLHRPSPLYASDVQAAANTVATVWDVVDLNKYEFSFGFCPTFGCIGVQFKQGKVGFRGGVGLAVAYPQIAVNYSADVPDNGWTRQNKAFIATPAGEVGRTWSNGTSLQSGKNYATPQFSQSLRGGSSWGIGYVHEWTWWR